MSVELNTIEKTYRDHASLLIYQPVTWLLSITY